MPVEEPIVDPDWGDSPEKNEHAKFKNIYQITYSNSDVDYCILSALNDVIFLENITITSYTANTTIATLDNECIPNDDIYMPCVISSNNVFNIDYIHIDDNGDISLPNSYSDAIIHTKGLSINICCNFFTKED